MNESGDIYLYVGISKNLHYVWMRKMINIDASNSVVHRVFIKDT